MNFTEAGVPRVRAATCAIVVGSALLLVTCKESFMYCSGMTMVSKQLLDLIKWPSEGFSWR